MKPHAHYYQSLVIHEQTFLKNIETLQQYFQKPLGVVVKGNAYGHGLMEASRLFIKAGVKRLICYHLTDALTLREQYPDISILLIGPVEVGDLENCAQESIELTIWNLSFLKTIIEFWDNSGANHAKLSVHLEIETGMYRTGIVPEELLKEWKGVFDHSGVNMVGFSTHLSGADEKNNMERVKEQLHRFRSFKYQVRDVLPQRMADLEWHGPNSAGLMLNSIDFFTHSRIGLLAYGFFPSEFSRSLWPAEYDEPTPALEWNSRIAGYQDVPSGKYTGYGQTYQTKNKTKTVMIPTGYGDGFPRALSNHWQVEIAGQNCPVIGRVNMNQIIVAIESQDLSGAEKPATLIQAKGDFDWYHASRISGRFIYELLTGISPKIVRQISGLSDPSVSKG